MTHRQVPLVLTVSLLLGEEELVGSWLFSRKALLELHPSSQGPLGEGGVAVVHLVLMLQAEGEGEVIILSVLPLFLVLPIISVWMKRVS